MVRRRDVLTAAAVALLVVAVDQATKLWAQQALSPGREVTVIGNAPGQQGATTDQTKVSQ